MTLPELAKSAVENYLQKGTVLNFSSFPHDYLPEDFFTKKAGTFVTIEKNKELRGCIGTYLSTKENIIQEVIDNAISAAVSDPRFAPVSLDELSKLRFIVYLLGEPEQINDIGELDPKDYGVIVKSADFPEKVGLLLPDLEGVDTIEKQIYIAYKKAGINPAKEKIELYRFKADKYS